MNTPKKIVIASDSFKGTLSSSYICSIAEKTVGELFPGCVVESVPLADGGEGTVESFVKSCGAKYACKKVPGPDFEGVYAVYAIKEDNGVKTAIIEMAAAAGLPLMTEGPDAENASTYGVGCLLDDALKRGCRRILMGLGGSATTDGGCGMAAALGARFYDKAGMEFIPAGGGLCRIDRADLSECEKRLAGVEVIAMCDVNNPLFGERGAAYVYGPQKGADSECVKRLDGGLRNYAKVLSECTGKDYSDLPGSGAAGGLGAGVMWFLGGTLQSGTKTVIDAADFAGKLKGADLVVTGEGRLDSQSFNGKLLSGVKQYAEEAGVPMMIIAGCMEEGMDTASLNAAGIYVTNKEGLPFEEVADRADSDYALALKEALSDYFSKA